MTDHTDIKFASGNQWDIPTLDLNHQADRVILPFTKYGSVSRKAQMKGTYHFYTDDYKFNGLWSNPGPIIDSHCQAVVEPNYSTHPDTPRAFFIADLYRKRWLARYWQSHGIRVFVDLNVEREFLELSFLGVPQKWAAYAVRCSPGDLESGYLNLLYKAGRHRAGDSSGFIFLVYGGGKAAQQWTTNKPGAVWLGAEYKAPESADHGNP